MGFGPVCVCASVVAQEGVCLRISVHYLFSLASRFAFVCEFSQPLVTSVSDTHTHSLSLPLCITHAHARTRTHTHTRTHIHTHDNRAYCCTQTPQSLGRAIPQLLVRTTNTRKHRIHTHSRRETMNIAHLLYDERLLSLVQLPWGLGLVLHSGVLICGQLLSLIQLPHKMVHGEGGRISFIATCTSLHTRPTCTCWLARPYKTEFAPQVAYLLKHTNENTY